MGRVLIEVTDRDDEDRTMLVMDLETDDRFNAAFLADRVEKAVHAMDLYGARLGYPQTFLKIGDDASPPTAGEAE